MSKLFKEQNSILQFEADTCIIQEKKDFRRIDLAKERHGLYYLKNEERSKDFNFQCNKCPTFIKSYYLDAYLKSAPKILVNIFQLKKILQLNEFFFFLNHIYKDKDIMAPYYGTYLLCVDDNMYDILSICGLGVCHSNSNK